MIYVQPIQPLSKLLSRQSSASNSPFLSTNLYVFPSAPSALTLCFPPPLPLRISSDVTLVKGQTALSQSTRCISRRRYPRLMRGKILDLGTAESPFQDTPRTGGHLSSDPRLFTLWARSAKQAHDFVKGTRSWPRGSRRCLPWRDMCTLNQ